jgi:hypothetical protein
MKTVNAVIALLGKLCFLCVWLLLAAWAIRQLIRMVHAIRMEWSSNAIIGYVE